MNHHYWVYILHCENNTYYTGYTNDLQKRYESHCNGTGKCKYTRSFKPKGIAQSWEIREGKTVAMHVERQIKKLSRSTKVQLIANPNSLYEVIGTMDVSINRATTAESARVERSPNSSTR